MFKFFQMFVLFSIFIICLNSSLVSSQDNFNGLNIDNSSFILKNYTDFVSNFIQNFSFIVKNLKTNNFINVLEFSKNFSQIIPNSYEQEIKFVDKNNKVFIEKTVTSFENEFKKFKTLLKNKLIKGSVEQLNHLNGVGPKLFFNTNNKTSKILNHSISILTQRM